MKTGRNHDVQTDLQSASWSHLDDMFNLHHTLCPSHTKLYSSWHVAALMTLLGKAKLRLLITDSQLEDGTTYANSS